MSFADYLRQWNFGLYVSEFMAYSCHKFYHRGIVLRVNGVNNLSVIVDILTESAE